MRFGYSDRCLAHDPGNRHPEVPDRLRAIQEGLSARHGVTYVEADPCPLKTVKAIHDDAYVEELQSFCESGGGKWDPDTVAVPETWNAALTSAGLACWSARVAARGPHGSDSSFALCRPPGHHAVGDNAMGFCFFNNVAVAAESIIQRDAAKEVAIIDWDVHHGNGTQDIFYDREDVLYVSIHEEGLYPGTGLIEETGTGMGEGTTLNAPLPPGSGDAAYRGTLDDIVLPVMCEFDPEVVLVSAGFDAHRYDPISRMRLSTEGYGMMADRLREFADRNEIGVGFVLEGGYSLEMLAKGVGMVHEVFQGYEPVESTDTVSGEVERRIDRMQAVHGLGS